MNLFIHTKQCVYVLILFLYITTFNAKPKEFYLTLINAIKNHDIALSTQLLKTMNPNDRLFKKNNRNHMSALNFAIYHGNQPIINLLIHRGANLYSIDRYYHSPLINAIIKNDIETTTTLLNNKVNPNQTGYRHQSALHIAVIKGKKQIIKLLLMHGAKPNSLDDFNQTPLDYAKKNKQMTEIIALLIACGAKETITQEPPH